jgi:hypothetical protein
LSELVPMDNTYLDLIKQRRKVINDKPSDTVGYNPVAQDAVHELYTWIFSTYLPKRYPSTFKLVYSSSDSEKASLSAPQLHNLVTNEYITLEPLPHPEDCLKTLGNHIDNEFTILLPESDPNARPSRVMPTATPTERYHLHAFILAFPSGFVTRRKLSLSLASIHAPVPGYSTKLEKPMDRFFASLPFGKVVKRSNWSISMDGVRFMLDGTHLDITGDSGSRSLDRGAAIKTAESNKKLKEVKMAPGHYKPTPEEMEGWKKEAADVDGDKAFLRVERQTLHRLEKTGAIVFGFKTYMDPLSQIRADGQGPALAATLRGMNQGSVPAIDVYKGGVVWREPLVEYLMQDIPVA